MKISQPLALLAVVMICVPNFAQADDLWDDAFPYDASTDNQLIEGNIAAAEMGFGYKAVRMGEKFTKGEAIGTESWFKAKYREIAEGNIKESTPEFKDLLLKRERLEELDFAATMRELNEPELKEVEAIKATLSQKAENLAQADRLIDAERVRITGKIEIPLPDHTVTTKEELAEGASHKKLLVRGASLAAGAYLVGDGAVRMGVLLQKRDPGYAPMITAGKHLVAPGEAKADELAPDAASASEETIQEDQGTSEEQIPLPAAKEDHDL